MITKQKLFWPISLGIAIIFQALFFKLQAGLNYLAFTLILLCTLQFYLKPGSYSNSFKFILFLFLSITGAVIFAHTAYSFFIYWIITTILISVACYSEIKHLQLTPLLFLNGLESFLNSFQSRRQVKLTSRIAPYIKFIFLPIFTILILLWLYSFSNPLFSKSIENILEFISKLTEKISFPRFFFTILGFVMAVIFIGNRVTNYILNTDQGISHYLIRIKNKVLNLKGLSKLLLRKKQVAVGTFIILNIMIAWLNYLDIKNIWIDFTWDGGLLKSMVHDGTNMLIVAILISIGITLFYLNSNLVFLKNNRFFYGLLILWLVQNILMAISVSIRNSLYIEHFSLAYKRIFVYFFLLTCAIGLLSIIYKIIFKRSISFILSINSFSVLGILLISACFNWDKIIAEYNFKNYKTSFVHYSFLVDLNNSALPFLIKTDAELNTIYEAQDRKFKLKKDREFERIDYSGKIQNRKQEFIKRWETKNIMEWNYPEYVAYNELTKH